jgi:hypothetical protein
MGYNNEQKASESGDITGNQIIKKFSLFHRKLEIGKGLDIE